MKFTIFDIAMLIGVLIGLAFSALLFFFVPWYHDLTVWAWTNPVMWLIGIAAGAITIAYDRYLSEDA